MINDCIAGECTIYGYGYKDVDVGVTSEFLADTLRCLAGQVRGTRLVCRVPIRYRQDVRCWRRCWCLSTNLTNSWREAGIGTSYFNKTNIIDKQSLYLIDNVVHETFSDKLHLNITCKLSNIYSRLSICDLTTIPIMYNDKYLWYFCGRHNFNSFRGLKKS